MPQIGQLYIVAVPIGNYRDITLRALDILHSVDLIICEEKKEGQTLLKRLGITREVICLNEHNEIEQAPMILAQILQGQSMALISDCGTPVFSDPGHQLIQGAVEYGIQVIPIPGPSSLMAALSILDFKLDHFVFAGFLPRESEDRRRKLKYYRSLRMPVVLMDAPYRLSRLVDECILIFGKDHRATLTIDLTLSGESILRDSLFNLKRIVGAKKAEFVLILH